jgi:hypothetical protein
MRNYQVYFELYGKRMKARVTAENELKAAEHIRKKLSIVKVEEAKYDVLDELDRIWKETMDKVKNETTAK